MYSLFLSVGHGAFRCGVVLNINDNSRFAGSQVSHVLFLFFDCGLKRNLVVVVCVVGLVILFSLLHPSLFLQCFVRHLCSIRTCRNGTCPKLPIWRKCSRVPHHSPRSGAAMIGQVEFLVLISQIPAGEKLSVAPPANFTIQQQWTATRARLDNTTILPT